MHHMTESFPAKTGGYPGMLINTIINTVASMSSHSWELKGLFPLVIAIKLNQI